MIYRMNLNAALVNVDMDTLKVINDTLGHAAGDQAIIQVAKALEGICRSSDIIARIGGDEFVILAHGAEGNPEDILAGRLEELLIQLKKRTDTALRLSFSYGIIPYEAHNKYSLENALEIADRLMYEQNQNKKKL